MYVPFQPLASSLVGVSIAVKKRHDQGNLERKNLLHFHITVHHWRKSGQELKQGRNLLAGLDAEIIVGRSHWLALHGLLSLLSYKAQEQQSKDNPPSQRTHTMGWVLSHQSLRK
jgi:hypothetical protein